MIALDEWGHEHLPGWLHKVVFGLLCDYVDMRLLGMSWRQVRADKVPAWPAR